jgi:hypothetical protein
MGAGLLSCAGHLVYTKRLAPIREAKMETYISLATVLVAGLG